MQSLLEKVKDALHIRNTAYDDRIKDLIEEAKKELARGGVSKTVADDEENHLVRSAIEAYCQMNMTEVKERSEIFTAAFTYRQDCLRKSKDYKAV